MQCLNFRHAASVPLINTVLSASQLIYVASSYVDFLESVSFEVSHNHFTVEREKERHTSLYDVTLFCFLISVVLFGFHLTSV